MGGQSSVKNLDNKQVDRQFFLENWYLYANAVVLASMEIVRRDRKMEFIYFLRFEQYPANIRYWHTTARPAAIFAAI